jgi:hypothetical protein
MQHFLLNTLQKSVKYFRKHPRFILSTGSIFVLITFLSYTFIFPVLGVWLSSEVAQA